MVPMESNEKKPKNLSSLAVFFLLKLKAATCRLPTPQFYMIFSILREIFARPKTWTRVWQGKGKRNASKGTKMGRKRLNEAVQGKAKVDGGIFTRAVAVA